MPSAVSTAMISAQIAIGRALRVTARIEVIVAMKTSRFRSSIIGAETTTSIKARKAITAPITVPVAAIVSPSGVVNMKARKSIGVRCSVLVDKALTIWAILVQSR